jgi:hypothetical protein
MTGVIAGVGCGLVEYFLLARFTKAVTNGGLKLPTALLLATFFFPVAVILPFAFMVPSEIHIMGIAAASVLTIYSLIRFILEIRK